MTITAREQEDAGYILMQDIELAAQTKDPEAIAAIRALWDDEPWEEIVEKAHVEGSTWYVWWMQGVRAFVMKAVNKEALPLR